MMTDPDQRNRIETAGRADCLSGGDQGVRPGRCLDAGPARDRPRHRRGRVRGDHGAERIGQIDLHEHPRLPRHADRRELSFQGRRGRQPDPQPARPAAPPLSGVRLSGVQPPEPHLGAGKRGAAADLPRRLRRRAARARPRGPGDGRPERVGDPIRPANSPEDSSSGSRSPARSSPSQRSCWRTSRRETSIRPEAARSWSC